MGADRTPSSSKSSARFIGRDGQVVMIERIGIERARFSDLYHRFLTVRWRWWLLGVVLGYVLLNASFALAYLALPECIEGARPGHFGDAFAFSVQTFSTIGYGAMSPAGMYANTIVTLEAIVGLLYQALVTGLAFAKFARPTARVMFTDKVCITTHEGKRALMVRMANERANQVVEATLSLTLLVDTVTSEGGHMRKLRELKLVRPSTPVFSLSWTAIHLIDEVSPLHGETRESLEAKSAQLLATFVGTDDTFNQVVHARSAWSVDDFAWDHHYADIILFREDGERVVDYRRFHQLVPDDAPREARPRAS